MNEREKQISLKFQVQGIEPRVTAEHEYLFAWEAAMSAVTPYPMMTGDVIHPKNNCEPTAKWNRISGMGIRTPNCRAT